MPVHDWTRVFAGTFHDFHSSWIVHLKEALNSGVLPGEFYALAEQHAGAMVPDVLTLTTRREGPLERTPQGAIAVAEAPPQVSVRLSADEQTAYRLARRTLTIRHRSGRRIVAMIEILSPGNKDSAQHVEQFVDKAAAAIQSGIHLLIIDLFPPGDWDRHGIHGAIWSVVDGSAASPPPDRPLVLAAYRADRLPEAYLEPIAVGQPLPQMPLFLTTGCYVWAPLEDSYMAAYAGLPSIVTDAVEGRSPPESEQQMQ